MIKCYRLANYVHVSNFHGKKIDSFLVTLTKYVCIQNHSTIISNIVTLVIINSNISALLLIVNTEHATINSNIANTIQ